MHVNETVRLESQTKDNLARRLFCEAFQQPWLEEKPGSPGFHLPAAGGDRVAGGCPVFSWHAAAFLPTKDSFPHSLTRPVSHLLCPTAKCVTRNGSFCLESIPSGAFSQSTSSPQSLLLDTPLKSQHLQRSGHRVPLERRPGHRELEKQTAKHFPTTSRAQNHSWPESSTLLFNKWTSMATAMERVLGGACWQLAVPRQVTVYHHMC